MFSFSIYSEGNELYLESTTQEVAGEEPEEESVNEMEHILELESIPKDLILQQRRR